MGIGVSSPKSLLNVRGGAILFDSTIGGTPVSGAGTRMMWIPAKAAFRSGAVDGTHWDDVNIGNYSFATGYNTIASGFSSIAMGRYDTASGGYSTALGFANTASGTVSLAMGLYSISSGYSSTTIGTYTTASGDYSTSMGQYSIASGRNSLAMGWGSIASGSISTASGYFTKSKSYAGLAIGLYNDSTNAASPGNINSLNRLFQIGNGTAENARNNAMTVLQNGNIGIGELNPTSPLNFASTLGDKIALWGNGSNHYGLGIQPSLLQLYTMDGSNDIAFGYGSSAVLTENVRFKGNGNVGIGTNAPTALLDVNGTTTTNAIQVSNGTVFTKMQSGSATVGSSATAQKTITIIFPVGFTSATPKVFATARNEAASSFADSFSVSVRSITATSVTLNVQRTDSITGWGQALLLDWFAVE